MEKWKPVVGFEGLYEVSDLGSVRTLRGWAAGRILRPSLDKKGYERVDLRGSTKKVHRIVLEAFRGPCPVDCEGAHLNGDPSDNKLSNLAWKTSAENKADQVGHKTAPRGQNNGRAKLSDDDVLEIRALRKGGSKWSVIHERWPHVGYSTIVMAGGGSTFRHLPR